MIKSLLPLHQKSNADKQHQTEKNVFHCKTIQ